MIKKKWSQMLYMWFHFVDSQVSDEVIVMYYVSMKPNLRTERKVEITGLKTDDNVSAFLC